MARFDISEKGLLTLSELYNPVILKTDDASGSSLSICQRDGSFEILVSDESGKESHLYQVQGKIIIRTGPDSDETEQRLIRLWRNRQKLLLETKALLNAPVLEETLEKLALTYGQCSEELEDPPFDLLNANGL